MKKLNAIKSSRSLRLDLLKHQHPAAKGISARVKLKLNAFSATTIIISANSIHMVRGLTGLGPAYPLWLGASQGRATELDIPQVVPLPFVVKSNHATSRGSHSMKDNTVSNKYGLPQVQNRPQIKAEKNLCLNGEEGRQIIKSETKLTLKTHEKTFTRLADM